MLIPRTFASNNSIFWSMYNQKAHTQKLNGAIHSPKPTNFKNYVKIAED